VENFMRTNGPGVIIFGFMLVGIVLMVVTAITIHWMNVRREETRAHLVRDLVDRGIPLDQVERLVNPTAESNLGDKRLEGKLASVMIENEIPAATMERVLRTYRQTDPATKQAMFKAIEEMVEAGPSEEQLLAGVNALCPARPDSPPTAHYQQAPASV
jgi:hypothetical protein